MVQRRIHHIFERASRAHAEIFPDAIKDHDGVIDGETKIGMVLEQAAKDVGADVSLTGFVRFALGEGIEREEGDFAAEVAAQISG